MNINFLNDLPFYIDPDDLKKGIRYWIHYINYSGSTYKDNIVYQIYNVESESTYDQYEVKVGVSKGRIVNGSCSCFRFREHNSCKHLAAVLIRYSRDIIRNSLTKEEITENILTAFYNPDEDKKSIKRELKISINFTFYENTRNESLVIPQIKIGIDRLYSLNNKIKKFYEVYDDETDEVVFGKAFTYNKSNCYFNDEDEKIIEFLKMVMLVNERDYFLNNLLNLDYKNMRKFLNLIKGRTFSIDNFGFFNSFKEENPYDVLLKQVNGKYHFVLSKPANMIELNSRYAIKDGEFYIIPDNIVRLKEQMERNNFSELVFSEDSLEKFS